MNKSQGLLKDLKVRPIFRFSETANGIPDWPTECRPISECQIPNVYKLQRSTDRCSAAYLICVCSKTRFMRSHAFSGGSLRSLSEATGRL